MEKVNWEKEIEKETQRQTERDKESELECLMYVKLNYPDTFKRTYPKSKDIENYYWDRAGRIVEIYDRRITSFLTQYGVQIIDTWFPKQIQGDSKYSKEELKNMIRRNPHLHNVIKTNLLSNLRRK